MIFVPPLHALPYEIRFFRPDGVCVFGVITPGYGLYGPQDALLDGMRMLRNAGYSGPVGRIEIDEAGAKARFEDWKFLYAATA